MYFHFHNSLPERTLIAKHIYWPAEVEGDQKSEMNRFAAAVCISLQCTSHIECNQMRFSRRGNENPVTAQQRAQDEREYNIFQ